MTSAGDGEEPEASFMQQLPAPDPIRAQARRTRRRQLVPEEAFCFLCGYADPTGLTLEDDHVLGASAEDGCRVWLCLNCHRSQTAHRLDHSAGTPPGRVRPQVGELERRAYARRSGAVFFAAIADRDMAEAGRLIKLAQYLDEKVPSWREDWP